MPLRVLFVSFVIGWTIVGCGPSNEIQTYKVPKPVEVPLPELTGDYQILGAMFPEDNPQYFFKFSGKASDLAPYAAMFEKMMTSVRFPNGLDKEPFWDTPMGWEVGGKRGEFVLATVNPDPKNKLLEISLSQAGGGVFGNAKRWAGQIGQVNFKPGHVPKTTKKIMGDKVAGLWIDIRGPKAPPVPGKGPMMMGNPHQ